MLHAWCEPVRVDAPIPGAERRLRPDRLKVPGAEGLLRRGYRPPQMGERGDRERAIAASEREQAEEQRAKAAEADTGEERFVHERAALAHDETARLHRLLADVYDREDS